MSRSFSSSRTMRGSRSDGTLSPGALDSLTRVKAQKRYLGSLPLMRVSTGSYPGWSRSDISSTRNVHTSPSISDGRDTDGMSIASSYVLKGNSIVLSRSASNASYMSQMYAFEEDLLSLASEKPSKDSKKGRPGPESLMKTSHLHSESAPVEEQDHLMGQESFRQWQTIKNVFMKDDVALITGFWLTDLGMSRGTLPRRQDMRAEAFLDMRRVSHNNSHVIAISYCWFTRAHPDPHGYQVQIMCRMLNQFEAYWVDSKTGLFIDWCSLYQMPRTNLEQMAHQRGMQHVNVLYAHQDTFVWMLTKVLPHLDIIPYHSRGWPTFERALSQLITMASMVWDLGKLNEDCEDYLSTMRHCVAKREAPKDPKAFEQALAPKTFTQDIDRNFVVERYAITFKAIVLSATQLCYSGLMWNDNDCATLATALPNCLYLTALDLSNNSITAAGAEVLCKYLSYCKILKKLVMEQNKFACMGAEAVARTVSSCPQLRVVNLRWNSIDLRGFAAFAQVDFPPRLDLLDLRGNIVNTGHSGAAHLIDAWRRAGKPVAGLKLSPLFE